MNTLSIQKNISKVITTLVVISSLFIGSAVFAAPGDLSTPALNAGKASQPLSELVIGGSASGAELDVSLLNSVSTFPKSGNIMAIFGNLLVRGNTFIGANDLFSVFDNTLATVDLSARLNKLNIAGTMLATNLSYSTGETEKKLCVNELGVIKTCTAPVVTPTYAWSTGAWGACNSGTKARTVTCLESPSGSTVADSLCTNPKPVTTSVCSTTGQSCNVPSDCTTAGQTCVGASVRPTGGCTGTYTVSGPDTSVFARLGTPYAYAAPGDVDYGGSVPPGGGGGGGGGGTASCTGFQTSNSCLARIGCSWAPETYSVTTPGTCQTRSSCFFGTQANPDFSNTPVDASGEVEHYGMVCSAQGNLAPLSVMQNSPYNNTGANYRYRCDDGTFQPIGSPGNSTCSLNSPATVHVSSDNTLYEDWFMDWIKA